VEVFLAVILLQLLWPSFLRECLQVGGFLGWIYGPEFQADFAANKLTGPDVTRLGLWLSSLSLPLDVLSVVGLFHVLSGTRAYQLGLTTTHAAKHLLLGVITTVCVVPLVYMILTLVNLLLWRGTGGAPEPHPIQQLFENHPLPIDFVVGGLSAIVAAPVLEEFLFRGIIQPWFRVRSLGGYVGIAGALLLAIYRRWSGLVADWGEIGWHGAWPQLLPAAFVILMVPGYLFVRAKLPPAAGAVYATSLLFAAAHSFAWPSPVPLFFLALALGALRYRTQSLVPPIAVHALFNSVAWALLLLQADKPEKGKDATEPPARVESISTSSAVPASVLPRRMYASAITVPSAGE
jgi:membrane protease YdiL (CAAX protease family)